MISIIAALDNKRGIGKNNLIPWHISEDLKRFKDLTKGHAIIMGSNTFEAIGNPLPERKNIIITNDPGFNAKGAETANSVGGALEKAGHGDIFIIGGAQIFNQTLGIADKLYLTLVDHDFNCDTFFPDYSIFSKEKFIGAGEENGLRFKFIELEKE
jgi:dihydrofolate reductase